MSEWSLRLEFPEGTPREFALGFECGRVWAMLAINEGPFQAEMHAENAEMILRIAEATGRTVRSEELDENWLTVTFGGTPPEPN